MHFHVIRNAMRNGVRGYVLAKSFTDETEARRYVSREGRRGKPAWIIIGGSPSIPSEWKTLPRMIATRWNSGSGFVTDTMPKMPYLGEK